jgi:hypothetical protein
VCIILAKILYIYNRVDLMFPILCLNIDDKNRIERRASFHSFTSFSDHTHTHTHPLIASHLKVKEYLLAGFFYLLRNFGSRKMPFSLELAHDQNLPGFLEHFVTAGDLVKVLTGT